MTHPDLEREIEELLPCENIDKLMCRCEPDTGRPICNACKRRPAVVTWAEHKVEEARLPLLRMISCDDERGETCDPDDPDEHTLAHRCLLCQIAKLRRETDAARADSDLLTKVEAVLKECSDLTLFELQGDYFIDDPPTRIMASTLVEALRKLVGEES